MTICQLKQVLLTHIPLREAPVSIGSRVDQKLLEYSESHVSLNLDTAPIKWKTMSNCHFCCDVIYQMDW